MAMVRHEYTQCPIFFFFSVFQFFHAMENDDDNILMLFFIYIYIYIFIYLFILLYNWKEKGLFSYDSIAKMLENI